MLIDPLQSAAFHFTPSTQRLEGAAFSRAFKTIAIALVAGCAGWFVALLRTEQLVMSSGVSGFYLLGALGILAWTLWHIVTSKTTLSAEALHQSWIWDKRMAVRDLAYAKLIRAQGLEWLVAPRLYCRNVHGKFAVFYVATPALWSECERLVSELAQMRERVMRG